MNYNHMDRAWHNKLRQR